ncbi:MAG: archaeosortase H N-terminal-like domain-containing protein [Candidatus Hermodarchaeota archaeon]
MEEITLKKLFMWILLTINLLFSYIIGLSIPQLETENSYLFGVVMIPLLIILNYVILDRFHFYARKVNEKEENVDAKN